jgi:hypothetical protein
MNALLKLALVGATTCFLGVVATVPSMAQKRVVQADAYTATYYDAYQGPHGHYNSLSDYVRDVEGTPCGANCEHAAQERWAR